MAVSSLASPLTSSSHSLLQHKHNNPLVESVRFPPSNQRFSTNKRTNTPTLVTRASSSSSTREIVLKDFQQRRALKIISGLKNFDRENVESVVLAADKSDGRGQSPRRSDKCLGGATHVDIACDAELVKLAVGLTSIPICVSSVNPREFLAAVDAGARMVEIGNYDAFYEKGLFFSPEEILQMTKITREILPSIVLSVTVPHLLPLPDQVKLAELLEQEGVDIIQTEGGKCSNPTKSGVLGLIEKASPTLASAYSISRAVKIPVMCSSGLSAVTAPMAVAAGAAGVGIGSAVNRLNDVVAMIAEVRSIADSLSLPISRDTASQEIRLRERI